MYKLGSNTTNLEWLRTVISCDGGRPTFKHYINPRKAGPTYKVDCRTDGYGWDDGRRLAVIEKIKTGDRVAHAYLSQKNPIAPGPHIMVRFN